MCDTLQQFPRCPEGYPDSYAEGGLSIGCLKRNPNDDNIIDFGSGKCTSVIPNGPSVEGAGQDECFAHRSVGGSVSYAQSSYAANNKCPDRMRSYALGIVGLVLIGGAAFYCLSKRK